jgi:hypothetical protein
MSVCSGTFANIPPITNNSNSQKNSFDNSNSTTNNCCHWDGMTVEVPAFEECLDYLMKILLS